jgi:glycosyltransferase involved in cell wall biosynthesis
MRHILFIHNNFPGQFVHLSLALARSGRWRVFAVGSGSARAPAGVTLETYGVEAGDLAALDPAVRRAGLEQRRGEAAAAACQRLREAGCDPVLVVGHAGWGEMLFVRDVFPAAKIVSYLEFYFGWSGADVNFDPEFPLDGLAAMARVRARNAPALFAAADSDALVTPTTWQASRFPEAIRSRLQIIHEGVDTARAAPDPEVRLEVESGAVLTPQDEVLTFVARNLEPYRGFHVFMRALPAILAARPNAQVLIVGGKGTSYGPPPPGGRSWKSLLLQELRGRIDLARVHFLGRVPYDVFLGALQLGRAHVYLTYPFVLSWSVLEAMSCGALVIGSRTGPVQEVIQDGENGLLVDFFDAQGLADRAVAALAEPERYATQRAAGRASVIQKFDLRTRSLPRQIALVEELAGSATPAAGQNGLARAS